MAEETNEPSLSQALATPETEAVHSQVVIEKWLENQTKEIETRQLEVDLQKQTDNHNFEYAKTALSAQATDSESQRIHASQRHKRNLIFAGFMAAALISFLVYSLYSGKDQVALELIRAAVFIATGGAGGYALGVRKTQNSKVDK